MQKKTFHINHIPAILWGGEAERLVIAVHGNMSHKEDVPIELLAEQGLIKGYQVLSFDLPEHGDRKDEPDLCKVQNCVSELMEIMEYARTGWKHISVFGNSIGAYFSLMAYQNEPLEKALFLSPVVDMRRLIENMMMWFQITEEQLQKEQTIPTPVGQTLYWDYYSYVKEHPVNRWDVPTFILYGEKDDLCERDTITAFADQFSCHLRTVPESEHYFHTPEDLRMLKEWIAAHL